MRGAPDGTLVVMADAGLSLASTGILLECIVALRGAGGAGS